MSATWAADEPAAGPAPLPDATAQQRFRDLMLPHLASAYNLARYLARDETLAEDLVQDSFVRALRAFGTFRGENAKGWLLAIVRNRFLTAATARGLNTTISLDAYMQADAAAGGREREICDVAQETPETALIRNDEAAGLRDMIEALPSPYREVIVLRELEELSYQEIATV